MAKPSAIRHFLDLDEIDARTLRRIIDAAHTMKAAGKRVPVKLRPKGIADDVLVLIFEKPSTRTRVSFDIAMRQLGGQTIMLNQNDLQLGRGESISDTARVLSRYADAVMLRANSHDTLLELAKNSTVPVINGLTDKSHPCQIMADILTFEESIGPIKGRKVAWVGDGNNVAASWMHAAAKFGFELRVACPDELRPKEDIVDWVRREKANVTIMKDAAKAVSGVDCIVTDTWVSMGDTDEARRKKLLKPYMVDEALMAKAAKGAIFMHCLPAYRGNEVTESVLEGPQSVVFDEAENRLHAQKAILAWCLGAV
ncbi:ornithine carbamoyltransferase [Hyphomicrobium nitrativorans NL23]|uniref:Ornithine carbamoyltransferase n=1 Tax=Hyphomicrobium nitrativorans NL23 TaxID=1029756 RepID=V5S9X7_9HYPH|nr:ornithine carbamoyltransferase [Hyphomicrobium nitrativorans]AHB47257.1 ornithine carbamoyltransferase [Hyphomicrobium nitrativorans NL23]